MDKISTTSKSGQGLAAAFLSSDETGQRFHSCLVIPACHWLCSSLPRKQAPQQRASEPGVLLHYWNGEQSASHSIRPSHTRLSRRALGRAAVMRTFDRLPIYHVSHKDFTITVTQNCLNMVRSTQMSFFWVCYFLDNRG